MSLKKLENQVRLMKAQVEFLTTSQKEQIGLNKKILAYSTNVLKSSSHRQKRYVSPASNFKPNSNTGYTFEVYSHLQKF